MHEWLHVYVVPVSIELLSTIWQNTNDQLHLQYQTDILLFLFFANELILLITGLYILATCDPLRSCINTIKRLFIAPIYQLY